VSVEAVLFDFGDTLVTTDPSFEYEDCLIQLHKSLTKNKIEVPYEDFKKAHSEVLDKHYKTRSLEEITFRSATSRALKCFGYNLSPNDERIVEAVDAHMQPFIKARRINQNLNKILQKLKGRYKLGIVSNFGHTPTLLKTLEKFDLTKFFDAVIVSADVGWRKPSRKVFEAALKALGVSASEAVFVGDSLRQDIWGARRVGMRTVLLRKRHLREETFGRVKPDMAIKGLNELPNLLLSL